MDPTLLCLLALVAADPRIDVDRAFADTPPPAVSKYSSDSSVGWSTSKVTSSTFDTRAIDSRGAADHDIPTPLGYADFVLRGQNPTYVQPGVDPFQGQPGVVSPPGAGFQQLPAPPMTMRFYAMYENVFLTPYFSQNTAFQTVGPGAGTAAVTEFSWDLEYSPRAEIGMVGPDGFGWRARYWHFEHSDNTRTTTDAGAADVIAPDPMTGAGIGSGVGFAPATSLSATHSLRLSVIDLEFLKKSVAGDRGLDVSFGLRYARIDQWLRGRATTAAGVLTANNALHHDFEGFGPTIAAEYRHPLWNSYWGVYGNARAALMYGDSNYRYDARAGGPLFATSRKVNDRGLQSSFEFQVGIDYRRPIFCCHEFLFRAGLESQYWANAGSASADLTGFGSASAQETDLGFFGFTVATGLTW